MRARPEILAVALLAGAHLAASPASARAKLEEVRLRVAEGTYVLLFEKKRISREQVKAAIYVSPSADIPGLDTLLEACDRKDDRYRDCDVAKPGNKAFLHNATVNVNRAVKKLRVLRELPVPKPLKAVHEFMLKNGTFYTWLLKTRLEFLRTGQVRALKREFGDIEPAKSCELALDRIEAAENGDQAFRIARTDWHNCVNTVFNERMGKYPRSEWNAFLQRYDIRERLDTE